MKQFKPYLLAGALLLAGAQQALADTDLVTYDESDTTNQITVYTSGATAQDPGIERFFALNQANNGVCQDGTLFIFRSSPDGNGDIANRLFFCQGNPGIAALNGKRVAYLKGSTGGSGNGVGPLVRPASIGVALWDITAGGGSMSTCSASSVGASGVQAAYTLKTGCSNLTFTTNASRPLEGGISDLEPARFATNFAPNLTSAELGTLNAAQVSAVIFGVPVSVNVRNKLQALTFGATDACVGDESLACQPSLTYKQLSAIYSQFGSYTSWAALKSRLTAGVTAANVTETISSVVQPALTVPTITICRRSNTSGTQAVFQTYFFKQNCGINNAASFAAIGPNAISNGGSPAVMSCIASKYDAGQGAIGILSTEFTPNNLGPTPVSTDPVESKFRFIKVGGVPPCLLDAVRSQYDLVGEASMQWLASLSSSSPKFLLMNSVRTRLQSKDAAQDVDSTYGQLDMCKPGTGIADRGKGPLVAPFASNIVNVPPTPFCAGCGSAGDVQLKPVLTATRNTTGPNSCSAFRDAAATELTINSQKAE